MKIEVEYSWPKDVSEAISLQNYLASKVRHCSLASFPKLIAACDVAFIGALGRQKHLVAGVIVYDISSCQVIERRSVIADVSFPYISGLLSFREAPSVLDALKLLESHPDVFLIDGQGIAHPRRFGLASHIGVLLDMATIGCAKSRLTGVVCGELGAEKGSFAYLEDKGEKIGAVLRTRRNVKPVYVSVGNKITLAEAIDVVLACTKKYRLPDPARMAHNYVTSIAKGLLEADKDYRR